MIQDPFDRQHWKKSEMVGGGTTGVWRFDHDVQDSWTAFGIQHDDGTGIQGLSPVTKSDGQV